MSLHDWRVTEVEISGAMILMPQKIVGRGIYSMRNEANMDKTVIGTSSSVGSVGFAETSDIKVEMETSSFVGSVGFADTLKTENKSESDSEIKISVADKSEIFSTINYIPDGRCTATFNAVLKADYKNLDECEFKPLEDVKNEFPEVRECPIHVLPEAFRLLAEHQAAGTQCPIDFLVTPMIAMLGVAIGSRAGLRPKQKDTSWLEIPNLYGMIVGAPSSNKTSSISTAFSPLNQIQNDHNAKFDEEMENYEIEYQVYEAREKHLTDELKASIKNSGKEKKEHGTSIFEHTQNELKELKTQRPDKPPEIRIKTTDATVEKLQELNSANPRGLLVLVDELSGFLNNFKKSGRESDRAYFLDCWSAKKIGQDIDRIGRGHTHIPRPCLSLFGGIQEGPLSKLLNDCVNQSNDGFIQRMQLTVWPDISDSYEFIDEPLPTKLVDSVNQIVDNLYWCRYEDIGGLKLEDEDLCAFNFTNDAQELFRDWQVELMEEIRGKNDLPVLMVEHLAKYPSLVSSLALIFHLVDCVSQKGVEGGVTIEALNRAIIFAKYLRSHANRMYSCSAKDKNQDFEKIVSMIKHNDLSEVFTPRDIYRNKSIGKQETESILDELIEMGWLARIAAKLEEGGRPSIKYFVNPLLKNFL
jgi:hypothetical protein